MADTTPMPQAPEPRKESFTEKPLPDEPNSDVKMIMSGGMVLRERVIRRETPEGFSLCFTYTKLDSDGNVMTNSNGEPLISPSHELALIGENVNRLGEKGLKDAIKEARKVGAARAVDHFRGIEMMSDLMVSRL